MYHEIYKLVSSLSDIFIYNVSVKLIKTMFAKHNPLHCFSFKRVILEILMRNELILSLNLLSKCTVKC